MPLKIVLVLEFLYAAAAIDKLLLSCKKRMASRTNIQPYLFTCRFGLPSVPAGTADLRVFIFGMNFLFHFRRFLSHCLPAGSQTIIIKPFFYRKNFFPWQYYPKMRYALLSDVSCGTTPLILTSRDLSFASYMIASAARKTSL